MTRASFRSLLLALLVGALLLAGCGDDGQASGDDTGTGDSGGAFPVTLEHKFGSTTVESEPKRVVVVGLLEQDALLALGVVPVATTEWFGEQPGALWPWAAEALEELDGEVPEVLGTSDALNFEAVAAQRPDLILGLYSGLTEDDYEKLEKIAPTVAQPEEHIDYGIPWDEMTRTVGAAVGKSDEAERVIDEVEAELAEVRAAHPEFDGASALVATPYEGIFVYGPADVRGRFLTDLGFTLPDDLVEATGEEFGGNLSQERADLLDVDVIVWLDPDDATGPLGGPLYETFRVHTEAREVFLDSFGDPLGAATSFVTPLSLPYLLDGLVPKLTAAIDGDPATAVPE